MKWITGRSAPLLTDLYELTMADAYLRDGMDGEATFELWVRDLAPERNFLVAAGIEEAIDHLGSLRFHADAIAYLASLDRFSQEFLAYLGDLRFTGDVWAVQEGTIAYGKEPLMRVTAPIIQAQILETFLLNAVGVQTLIASKAARVAIAAGDRQFVDFGARRSHGADAALKGARAAYIAGATATSLVAAGFHYGIPVTGTMAHSYILAHGDERRAFEAFARAFPNDAVMLIDTFDTVEGARIVAELAPILRADGIEVSAVRLDSGDLSALSKEVRKVLDDAGLESIRILASGGLDEHRVAALLADDAPIDGFGVGTSMMTSSDAPSLDIIYKLVEDPNGPVMKKSTGKANLPGIKQVFRSNDGDVIALADEEPSGLPLLAPAMSGGERSRPIPPLDEIREATTDSIAALPESIRRLDGPADPPWRVEISEGLQSLVDRLSAKH
ncbi:MAG TPA: nicotinate phosphoribosyltransferase [Acidimicrobiia bacterium]|nr:nicotinate phosphoribosyltransferase [Acidimicrobiia bacterium]